MKNTVIIVSAGNGVRMESEKPKQFLEVAGKPVLAHTLRVFEECDLIDDIVLVVAGDRIDYTYGEIVQRYGISKVSWVVEGGEDRCASVYKGLQACSGTEYVLIHDAVRPLVTEDIIRRGMEVAGRYGSAVCGVTSKDTVRIAAPDGTVIETPDRRLVWMVQTPQIFKYDVIKAAYDELFSDAGIQSGDPDGSSGDSNISSGDPDRSSDAPDRHPAEMRALLTDDAMVLERTGHTVTMFEGDHRNIKITTAEDLKTAECLLMEAEELKAAESKPREAEDK